MVHRIRVTVSATVLSVFVATSTAWAQPNAILEFRASLGASRVSRFEDRSFGTALSPGAGIELRIRPNFGIAADVHQVSGLTPEVARCGAPPGVTCVGTARDGITSATVASVTAAYYFGRDPAVQPFVIGGFGVVRSRGVSSLTMAGPTSWTQSETETHDTGSGVTAGAGLSIRTGDRMVIRPEWRIYDGSVMGRENLTVMRTSVAVGYRW
jgi:opacity protein-like surface antigen